MSIQEIKIVKNILTGNDEVAARNRVQFARAEVLAINVMASPGAGKTSLICRTIEAMQGRMRVGVVEGDIAGNVDTETVLLAGAADAVQINTGGSCHLEAAMVERALQALDLKMLDLLFVENVGNLVCPTHWALGEGIRLCLLSTPEGHDKPIKYPALFAESDVIVVNKVDLAPWVDFDEERFAESVRALNPSAPVIRVSCRTEEGIADWTAWLEAALRKQRAGENPNAPDALERTVPVNGQNS